MQDLLEYVAKMRSERSRFIDEIEALRRAEERDNVLASWFHFICIECSQQFGIFHTGAKNSSTRNFTA